jgi:hypothetical protein
MCTAHIFEGCLQSNRKGVHCKRANPQKILGLVRRMQNHFKGFIVEYIERNKNTKAGELAKAAAHNTPLLADVFFQVIEDTSVKKVEPEPKLINAIEGED